jgi:hypothetical protein
VSHASQILHEQLERGFDRLSHHFRQAQPPFSTSSATNFACLSHQFGLSNPQVDGMSKNKRPHFGKLSGRAYDLKEKTLKD